MIPGHIVATAFSISDFTAADESDVFDIQNTEVVVYKNIFKNPVSKNDTGFLNFISRFPFRF